MIADEGYRTFSLRAVAARAGLTKGAIYGIFDSKEALFLAVVQEKLPRRKPVFRKGLALGEQMRLYAAHLAAEAPAIEKSARLAMEFDLYLASNPHMRERARIEFAKGHERTAKELVAVLDESELPMPAEEFAVMIAALTGGLLYRHLIMPDVVTDEFIKRCFLQLAKL
jgi:AcrR family transcriptional regulator